MCLAMCAIAAMLGATGFAQATLPTNTTVPMQSEFVKGAYVNMSVRYVQGTIYPNGTVVNEPIFSTYRYFLNYTVTAANSTSFNETMAEGALNASNGPYPTLKILWPSATQETIAAQFPYTNDTNATDYVTAFEGMFSLVKNVTANLTSITYDYKGTNYAAINATVTGFGNDNFGYSAYPTEYNVVFSPYSGIIFSSILNQSELITANSPGGIGQKTVSTRFSGSVFQLNSTNIVIGEQQGRGGSSYTLLATGAVGAVVIASAIILVRHRNKHL